MYIIEYIGSHPPLSNCQNARMVLEDNHQLRTPSLSVGHGVISQRGKTDDFPPMWNSLLLSNPAMEIHWASWVMRCLTYPHTIYLSESIPQKW